MSNDQWQFDQRAFLGASAPVVVAKLDLAKVAREAIALLSANLPFVLLVCLLTFTLPKLILIATHLSFHGRLSDEDKAYDVLDTIEKVIDFGGNYVLGIVLGWGLVRQKQNQPLTFPHFLSVLGPSILAVIFCSFLTAIGFLFLIVPGIILLVRWSLTSAIVVAENMAATRAMARSADLARGCGWPILGAVLVGYLFSFLFETIVSAFGEAVDGVLEGNHVDWIIEAIGSPWTGVPLTVISVALYFQLVTFKEGGNTDQIADIFD